MSKTPIYRWSGEYFGFIYNGKFFDADSNYLCWIDDENRVWRADGTFLGEIVDDNYILRQTTKVEPVPRVPKLPPVPPVPPVPRVGRVGRVPKVGWKDALDEYK